MSATKVQAVVKWFNPKIGYGFVEIQGNTDALVHVSKLKAFGFHTLPKGTQVECTLSNGDKGPQIEDIFDIKIAPTEESGTGPWVDATVKFYNTQKNYGFLELNKDGSDIFLPGRVLELIGYIALKKKSAIKVKVEQTDKGLTATAVQYSLPAGEFFDD